LGFVAYGMVKILIALVYVIAASPVSRQLGVPAWMVAVGGAFLLIAGLAVIRNAGNRPVRTCVGFLASYDAGWLLATVVALVLARLGSGAGGEVWISYQAIAATALAAWLVAGAGQDELPRDTSSV
jgi:hypothetical protein